MRNPPREWKEFKPFSAERAEAAERQPAASFREFKATIRRAEQLGASLKTYS